MSTPLVIAIGLLVIFLAFESSCASRFSREVKFWKREYHSLHQENKVLNNKLEESERLSNSISALNIEVDATKERLKQSEFQCDLLRKESDDKSKRIVALLGEVEQLRSQLPKRDSKGRYCKRKEE